MNALLIKKSQKKNQKKKKIKKKIKKKKIKKKKKSKSLKPNIKNILKTYNSSVSFLWFTFTTKPGASGNTYNTITSYKRKKKNKYKTR